ncbi:MAG TPA: outer membrane beta-barrel protein [Gemmatimonadales bacterium]|nr:outer membrane beta-barrel protein [Gemmatimonadales bacterium]
MRALALVGLLLVPGALAAQVKLSGFAEASYSYSGHASGDSIIVGRLYDRVHDQYMLNALAVVLDKPYDAAKLSAGFHAELLFGQNASGIQSNGFKLGDQGDIPHLYVTLNLPTARGKGNGVQIKVGRIPTLLGLEVIETYANPNWSEGNQFIYVENFTGLGASLEAKLSKSVDAQFRVFNGWDVIRDNNHRKSVMGRVGFALDAATSIGIVGFWGPEQAGNDDANRYGAEALVWHKFGKAAVWAQADYGREESARWQGLGAWVTYDLSSTVGLALRGDYVDDRDGVRTSGALGFPANTGHRFGSATATLNVRTWPDAVIRPELRYDRSTLTAFDGNKGQVTFALAVTYLY